MSMWDKGREFERKENVKRLQSILNDYEQESGSELWLAVLELKKDLS